MCKTGMPGKAIIGLAGLATCLMAGSVRAAEVAVAAAPGSLQQQLEIQQQQIHEQAEQLQLYHRALLQQQGQLDELKDLLENQADLVPARSQPAVYAIPAPDLSPYQNAAQSDSVQNAQGDESSSGTSLTDDQGDPDRPPEVPILSDKGGVLLRQGEIVIEPSFEYTNTQLAQTEIVGFAVLPAILIGSFGIEEVDRESITSTLTTRVGITDRLEGEVKVPGVYRKDRATDTSLSGGVSGDVDTNTLHGFGLGDIEAGLHYQINDGQENWPFFVGNLRYKSTTGLSPFDVDVDADGEPEELPTGTGFHAAEASVTIIKPTDPAVIFGNVGYTYNFERSISSVGDVDPGDVIKGSLGVGFALNEAISLSMAYDHNWVRPTEVDGNETGDSLQIGRMLFGGSYRLNDMISFNVTFGVGVTDDAPDITAGVRVPIRFNVDDLFMPSTE